MQISAPLGQGTGLVHEFLNSLTVEARVLHILNNYWGDQGFVDVTKDKTFHARDVDYVYSPGRLTSSRAGANPIGPVLPDSVWVEVKADSTKYHNIFLELLSNGSYNVDTPGCFLFSQAYAWCYVFDDTKEMFVFELSRVRCWVLNNFTKLKPYLKATTNKQADGSFTPTVGFAVPVEKFLGWLVKDVAMAYATLPGFGDPVNGSVPRARLPVAYSHLNNGIDGITSLLDASRLQAATTPILQFRPETSPLRRHVIDIKKMAFAQTRGMYESVMKKSLGPHFEPLAMAV